MSTDARDMDQISDSMLESIMWRNGDLLLSFLSSQKSTAVTRYLLTLTRATDVTIDLAFGTLSGMALVWEASARKEAGGYRVEVDFAGAPPGRICALVNAYSLSYG